MGDFCCAYSYFILCHSAEEAMDREREGPFRAATLIRLGFGPDKRRQQKASRRISRDGVKDLVAATRGDI